MARTDAIIPSSRPESFRLRTLGQRTSAKCPNRSVLQIAMIGQRAGAYNSTVRSDCSTAPTLTFAGPECKAIVW